MCVKKRELNLCCQEMNLTKYIYIYEEKNETNIDF